MELADLLLVWTVRVICIKHLNWLVIFGCFVSQLLLNLANRHTFVCFLSPILLVSNCIVLSFFILSLFYFCLTFDHQLKQYALNPFQPTSNDLYKVYHCIFHTVLLKWFSFIIAVYSIGNTFSFIFSKVNTRPLSINLFTPHIIVKSWDYVAMN